MKKQILSLLLLSSVASATFAIHELPEVVTLENVMECYDAQMALPEADAATVKTKLVTKLNELKETQKITEELFSDIVETLATK